MKIAASAGLLACLAAGRALACVDGASISSNLPGELTLAPGQIYGFTLRLTNAGDTAWWNGNAYWAAASWSPADNAPTFACQTPSTYGGCHNYAVGPGGYLDYTGTITAPSTCGGTHTFTLREQHQAGWVYRYPPPPDYPQCAAGPGVDTPFGQALTSVISVPCKPNCDPCTSGSQCASGNCSNNFCALSGVTVGGPCGCNSAGTYQCDGDCEGVPPGRDPCQSCTLDCQCASGVCSGGVCVPSTLAGPCASCGCNLQCASGACSGGICTPCPNAVFVSQSVPSTMLSGSTYTVRVSMQNTGNTTWQDPLDACPVATNPPGSPCPYGLGSENPLDNMTWGLSRVGVAGSVASGVTKDFNFNVVAPVTPGTYNFQWRMVQERVLRFGGPSQNVAVQVRGANCISPCSTNSQCDSGRCDAGQGRCVAATFNELCYSDLNNCSYSLTGTHGCDGTCSVSQPPDCGGICCTGVAQNCCPSGGSCCGGTCCASPNLCCGNASNGTCCAPGYSCGANGTSCDIALPYLCTE